jgi:hypothetical protein
VCSRVQRSQQKSDLPAQTARELASLGLVLSRAGIKAPEESLFDWTMGTFMKRRCHLTAAEKRVLSAPRTHGRALRIWVGHRQDDYSWWIAGQPVTRMIHSLALKGHLTVEGDEARLTAGS